MTVLTIAMGDNDRTRPLIDGSVQVEGFDLAPVVLPPSEIFPRAAREAPFDICEFSASTHAIQTARGQGRYIAIPVFLSRSFRFDSIYVHKDSGIVEPKDLEGRLIGLPEYQMTVAVWVRGILSDHFGVDISTFRTRTGGIDTPGRIERIALHLPDDIDCRPCPDGTSLSSLLAEGKLDAVISPRPPKCFREGHRDVRRLFASPADEERAYYVAARMFPIMHLVGIRRDVADAHPELPKALMTAFEAARKQAHANLARMVAAPVLPLMLPWLSEAYHQTRAAMGADFWPYGFGRNEAELRKLCQYLGDQKLIPRALKAEDLFIDSLEF